MSISYYAYKIDITNLPKPKTAFYQNMASYLWAQGSVKQKPEAAEELRLY